MLINFDQPDAFGPFAPNRPRSNANSREGTATPRSLSRMSFTSSSRFSSSIHENEPESGSVASPNLSSTSSEPRPKEPFVPLLPDDFFAVWDAAKARAANAHRHQNGGVSAVPNGGDWQSWRNDMPGEESESGSDLEGDEHGDENDREGSVIYRSSEAGGDNSFDSEEAMGVMETPRPRSGFQ